jgi:molybdopterin biosynthesis enzyme
LVRADLIVVSGERKDDSFDLITRALNQLGEVKVVDLDLENSGHFNFGTIGPDKTPVVTLPGDPINAYIAMQLFRKTDDSNNDWCERGLLPFPKS